MENVHFVDRNIEVHRGETLKKVVDVYSVSLYIIELNAEDSVTFCYFVL